MGINGNKTHCVHGHEFAEENTRYAVRANGMVRRYCFTCKQQQRRRSAARRRGGDEQVGDRKTLAGARRLAQRTVQKVLAQGRVSENPAVSVAPLRQIVAREEFDYEVAGQTFHAVRIRLECGHKEDLGPCEWHPVRKRRRCVSCLHGRAY